MRRVPEGNNTAARTAAFNEIRSYCVKWIKENKPELYQEIKSTIYAEHGLTMHGEYRIRKPRKWENG